MAILLRGAWRWQWLWYWHSPSPSDSSVAAVAVKSLQSCLTLCDPIDGSPPGSPVPGILKARTPEWVAISFSNAWKWKVKVKSLSHVRLLATPWTAAYQGPTTAVHGIFQTRVLEWGAIAISRFMSSICYNGHQLIRGFSYSEIRHVKIPMHIFAYESSSYEVKRGWETHLY